MIYTYFCTNKKCLNQQDENHSVNGFKIFEPICEKCGFKCEYKFVPSVVNFILVDGPSGSWPSKGEHFKNFRRKKHEEMGRKQRDRYGEAPKLIPNIGGVQTSDWREQKDLVKKARSKL